MEKVKFIDDEKIFLFSCPHCNCFIQVEKLRCGIFRHGFYMKKTKNGIKLDKQINPHLSEIQCKKLVKKGKICGCANPFRLIKKDDEIFVEKCDYI